MVSYYPPSTYFNNINFNNKFYTDTNESKGINLEYANANYLLSSAGIANSRAAITNFNGDVNVLNLKASNDIFINGSSVNNLLNIINLNFNNYYQKDFLDISNNFILNNFNNFYEKDFLDISNNLILQNFNNFYKKDFLDISNNSINLQFSTIKNDVSLNLIQINQNKLDISALQTTTGTNTSNISTMNINLNNSTQNI